MLGNAIAATVVALGLAVIMFITALAGASFGAFAGWVTGLIWGDEILTTLKAFGVKTDGLPMWKIGCALGFVGAFFKSSTTTSKD